MQPLVVTREALALLSLEIERYLALVALLRREGHEPRWAPERVAQ